MQESLLSITCCSILVHGSMANSGASDAACCSCCQCKSCEVSSSTHWQLVHCSMLPSRRTLLSDVAILISTSGVLSCAAPSHISMQKLCSLHRQSTSTDVLGIETLQGIGMQRIAHQCTSMPKAHSIFICSCKWK